MSYKYLENLIQNYPMLEACKESILGAFELLYISYKTKNKCNRSRGLKSRVYECPPPPSLLFFCT